MNKKGFAYLISAILLASILIAVLGFDSNRMREEQYSDSKRLTYANDFVRGFNQDFERALQISSFRAVVSLEDHIALTYSYLNDTESAFREAIYYGTINGTPSPTMSNSTLLNYTAKVSQIASRFGINVSINITEIEITQSNPWFLDVKSEAEIFVNDTSNSAYWHYNKTFNSRVSIMDLRDPLYMVNFPSALHNTIRPNNFTYLVSIINNTGNLTIHYENGYYLPNPNAPNYLMRMENNYSASPTGIESLVNVEELQIQQENHPSYFPKRIKIDFIYFNNLTKDSSNNNYVRICNVTDMPDEFILTQDRLALYNVSLLNYSQVCP